MLPDLVSPFMERERFPVPLAAPSTGNLVLHTWTDFSSYCHTQEGYDTAKTVIR